MTRRVEVAATGDFAAILAVVPGSATPGAAAAEAPLEKWLGWLRPPGPWKETPAIAAAGDLPEIGLAPPDGSEGPWAPADVTPGQDPVAPVGPAAGNPIPGFAPVGECVVEGEISDVTTLEPIAGAIVSAVGTGREDETDSQGRFRIAGLPKGEITLEALKLGYSSGTAVVVLRNGTVGEARIALRVKPQDTAEGEYLLPAESIVGEYTESNQGDLFQDLQMTSTVTSGVSKEEFSTSGISDAADAVSKISGANIVGGKYAVVRGMADRYSNTLVNDAVISSADPSKKAVQLDLFPSDLLEQLSIRKTFTPELPADFAGGTVLIYTLRIPKERIIDFSVGTKHKPALDGDFWVIPGQRLSFWGDGSQGIPDGVGQRGGTLIQNPNRFAPGVTTGASPTQTPTALQLEALEEWRLLHSTGPFIARQGSPQEQFDFSANYADFHQLGKDTKLGWVFALTREQGADVERNVEVQRLAALAGPLDVFRRQIENRYKESVDWGFLGSATLEMGDDHLVSFTYFKNRAAENEVNRIRRIQNRQGDGENIFDSSQFRFNYLGASGIAYRAADVLSYLDRELELKQVNGSHILRDDLDRERFKISWMLSESDAQELRPDDRNLRFTTIDFADPRIPGLIATAPPSGTPPAPYRPELGVVETTANPIGGNPPTPYRQALSTIEQGDNQRIDFELPWYFDEEEDSRRKITLRTGFNRSTRDREARGDRYSYRIGFNRPPASVNLDQLGVDLYEQWDNPVWVIGATRPAVGQPPYAALGIQDISAAGTLILNTDTGLDVEARYLMAAFDWDRWNLYGGVRVEKSSRYYDARIQNAYGVNLNNTTQANTIGSRTIEAEELYPSLGVSRTFGGDDSVKILCAWSRTVARPTFLEFAPIITEDQATGEEIRGNPLLEDSEIDNFDLSLAWQASQQSFFQLSLFHKNLTNPITKVLGQRASDGFFISYANAESGTVQGIEIEADHRFNENWNIGGNLTYIASHLVAGNASIPAPIFAESFESQPNWILNFNLGYAIPEHGLTANLVYNFTGEYLAAVTGTQAVPSVLRDASNSLDLILRKSFDSAWGDGTVTFKVSNLLDDPTSFSYENGDVYSRFYPGREYSLSLSLGF